jgi:hypothetical protein
METRFIEQVKVYGLNLNSMSDKSEYVNLVALSTDRKKLEEWYTAEKAPQTWSDPKGEGGNWHKVFRQGSALEWYNPIEWSSRSGYFDQWVVLEELKDIKANFSNKGVIIIE